MKPKLPNFLLAGAAKCGTTAIANYLDQHPQIYLSPVKEPKFISSHFLDFPLCGNGDGFIESFTIKTFGDYQKLFRKARRKHYAIGEASVENLYYYQQSIPLIKRYLGDVKIIIVLRNPIERAFSAYKQLLRDERETETFERGLELEEERKRKNWEFLWFYRGVGQYASQVKAFRDTFSDVQVLFHEDFLSDPHRFCHGIFDFLGVDANFGISLQPRRNASGIPKNGFYRLILRASTFKGKIYRMLTSFGVSDSAIQPIVESIRNGGLVNNVAMNPETRDYLKISFRTEIGTLQNYLKRDLSHWLA